MVVHGDRDTLAPVQGARHFVQDLRAVSEEPVYYLELHGAQHAFETFASIRANAVIDSVANFLDVVHVAHRRAGDADPTAAEVEQAVTSRVGAEVADRLN